MTASLFCVGDTRAVADALPDNSINLVITSFPYLGQRAYLPDGHPDKHLEVGEEANPAEWLDAMLDVVAGWRRILADDGSACVELADTFSGSGGTGSDSTDVTDKAGDKFAGDRIQDRRSTSRNRTGGKDGAAGGWPAATSLCLLPEAFRFALVYGINPFTGAESPAGCWVVRNVVRWLKPNPAVGDDGPKFRPAVADMVVFAPISPTASHRWFDKTAVRRINNPERTGERNFNRGSDIGIVPSFGAVDADQLGDQHPDGAPPLDWACELEAVITHTLDGGGTIRDAARAARQVVDDSAGLGDGWEIAGRRYSGSHFATFSPELVTNPVKSMCPAQVCKACNTARRRIEDLNHRGEPDPTGVGRRTIGWTDCGCNAGWRPGVVYDPFGGSGTVGMVASGHSRLSVLADIDERNAALFTDRVGGLFAHTTTNPADIPAWLTAQGVACS